MYYVATYMYAQKQLCICNDRVQSVHCQMRPCMRGRHFGMIGYSCTKLALSAEVTDYDIC